MVKGLEDKIYEESLRSLDLLISEQWRLGGCPMVAAVSRREWRSSTELCSQQKQDLKERHGAVREGRDEC